MYVVEYEIYTGKWAKTVFKSELPAPVVADAKSVAACGDGPRTRVVDTSSPLGPCVIWESWNPVCPGWVAEETMTVVKKSWSSAQPSYQNIPKHPTDAELDRVAAEVFDEVQTPDVPLRMVLRNVKSILELAEGMERLLPPPDGFKPNKTSWTGVLWRTPETFSFQVSFKEWNYTVTVNFVPGGVEVEVTGPPGNLKEYVRDYYRRALVAPVQP